MTNPSLHKEHVAQFEYGDTYISVYEFEDYYSVVVYEKGVPVNRHVEHDFLQAIEFANRYLRQIRSQEIVDEEIERVTN